MSCHLELDFNDDGTVVMTAKPTKEAEPVKTTWPPFPDWDAAVVTVLGALDNETCTHKIIIANKNTIDAIKRATQVGRREESNVVVLSLHSWGVD